MLTTNIEALRGLYVALGGDVADVADITTLPEMLEKISTVASAAASELPPVTATDNGDVMTVVSGKWAKATPASELPSVGAFDIGKMLTVDNNKKWAKMGLQVFPCQVEHDTNPDTYTAHLVGMPYDVLNSYAKYGITMLGLAGWGGNCQLPYVGGSDSARKYAGIVYESSEFYAVIIECTASGCTIDVEKLSA